MPNTPTPTASKFQPGDLICDACHYTQEPRVVIRCGETIGSRLVSRLEPEPRNVQTRYAEPLSRWHCKPEELDATRVAYLTYEAKKSRDYAKRCDAEIQSLTHARA